MKKYNNLVNSKLKPTLSTPQEQLFFLSQFGAFYFWLHTFSASLLCILFWGKIVTAGISIIGWFLSILLLAIGCWLVKSRLTRNGLLHEQLMRYRLINLMLCTVWGMSGIFLFNPDPISYAVHLCILIIISLSVWPASLISPAEFYAQLALLLSPITLMLAMQQDLKTNVLCFVILAFVGITVLMTKFFAKILDHLFTKERSIVKQIPTNPVTELMSSDYFGKTLKTEWRRSARNQQPLSLIIIKIDNFHKIEKRLGFKITQEYLKSIAKHLRFIARRSSDTLSHYGNADFIILLPQTKLEEANRIAKSLQFIVQEAALPNPLQENQVITISVGTSSCVPLINNSDKPRNDLLRAISYPAGLLEEAELALKNGALYA